MCIRDSAVVVIIQVVAALGLGLLLDEFEVDQRTDAAQHLSLIHI